jgi:hypothetical protein
MLSILNNRLKRKLINDLEFKLDEHKFLKYHFIL